MSVSTSVTNNNKEDSEEQAAEDGERFTAGHSFPCYYKKDNQKEVRWTLTNPNGFKIMMIVFFCLFAATWLYALTHWLVNKVKEILLIRKYSQMKA